MSACLFQNASLRFDSRMWSKFATKSVLTNRGVVGMGWVDSVVGTSCLAVCASSVHVPVPNRSLKKTHSFCLLQAGDLATSAFVSLIDASKGWARRNEEFIDSQVPVPTCQY